MAPSLNPDYRDMLSCFIDAGVELLVVGAYAVGAYSVPRATGDIDLWVRPNGDNAARVIAALRAFGAPIGEVSARDFAVAGATLQIGVAPRRIDILTEIDGVGFEEAWSRKGMLRLDGLEVPVISKAHLLQNKRATGRRKDLADIALLEGED